MTRRRPPSRGTARPPTCIRPGAVAAQPHVATTGHPSTARSASALAVGTEEQFDIQLPSRYFRNGDALTVVFQDCTRTCRSAFSERVRRAGGEELRRHRGGDWRYDQVSP